MANETVLISGASIAGPALAYWLRRHGFTPTVVEVAPGLRPGGQAVDLRGAGREVVERMGLIPRVREDRVDERGVANVDANGRWVARMPADLFGGEGIVAEIEIMRGDLTRILHDATAGEVEYLFADRITELDQGDTGVRVRFASGTVRTFDLVVGADGVHSGVRRLAFGSEDEYVRPLGGYTAYFTVPDPGDLDDWFLMYNAPGGRVAGIRPERGGTAKAMLSFTSPPLEYDRRDVRQQQRLLTDAFAAVGWRVPALLDALADAPDFFFDSICQVHVPNWSRGRVTLLGDAGYCGSPLTGMGTSMALVGAYVLAGEMASARDDHGLAFARYQETMRDYVRQCQELPPGGIGGFAPQSRLMIWARNQSMRMMGHWPMRGILARQFQKADAITLPDYAALVVGAARNGLRPRRSGE
ncbi:FAD-dependent monooxygenase [Micromonospora ureilytica]|uniref:2-polyprenyl-6-methoxyphenol hydroxylase-like FAD-dependent oxidoreductase n=1 Tax=Micromonospora ureilytica TaxID=709868 RepID=A0ABS0JA91_9ACTN|nr:FAD-dependent monooxygenase [Micromonospora ureilytica]MBG6063914.1 2-polyprenyl-6-methoxyphenol hydroxylase-like FAD-dependent oxidoreductase [Micromonospora ureilytica]